MDSRRIDELLQKYWNAETSLEEEHELKTFFTTESIPEQFRETANLFQYFEMQKKVNLHDAHFDKELKKKLKPGGKVVAFSMVQLARIAAGLLVVVAATFFIREEIKKAYPDEPEDTYTDPKVAFEETKKALMMISKSFNKAQKQASKINILNQATEKIQHPEATKEPEKKTNI